MKNKLKDVLIDIISGEWGDEDVEGNGVPIIRTTNFTKDGRIDHSNIEYRLITKKVRQKNGGIVKKIDEEKIERKKLLDEDIIIEKSGGGIGSPVGRVVYFISPDNKTYLCNNFTQTLRVNKSKVLPKYVFYFLKYLYDKGTVLKYQNQTTGLFNLKLDRYLEEEIFIPELDIQHLIITQLDTIQKLIDNRSNSIKILNELIKSIYIKTFGNPIENPMVWGKKKLSDLGDWKSGGTPDTSIEEYYKGDIPWYTSGELGDIYISESKKKISDLGIKNSNAKQTPSNTLLIGMYDTAAFKLSITKEESSCNQAILYSKLDDDYYTLFVYYTLFLSKQHYLSKRKGARQKNLNATFIKNIEIIYPASKKGKGLIKDFYNWFSIWIEQKSKLEISIGFLTKLFEAQLQNTFKDKAEIDEEPIFRELMKRFTVKELKGNKQRLGYLLKLFAENKFDNMDDYGYAKGILFELIKSKEIKQSVIDDKISLVVNETN